MLTCYISRRMRVWLILSLILFVIILHSSLRISKITVVHQRVVIPLEYKNVRLQRNWRHLEAKDIEKLSALGRMLFLEEPPPILQMPKSPKTYQILVWKYGSTIEERHMKQYGPNYIDPFENCSVNNCHVTYDDDNLNTADLVVFHMQRMENGELPVRSSFDQLWAFLTDESPYHTFIGENNWNLYNGKFNWSITYRMDSDIPVPYGRTVFRPNSMRSPDEIVLWKRRDVLVAVMLSDCSGKNNRWGYIKELQRHLTIHIYGGCGNFRCEGYIRKDCPDLNAYLFYLAFENSNCDGYITEKLWWNSYHKNAIPIVMGAKGRDYEMFLPPGSYIDVKDYPNPKVLAKQLLHLNLSDGFFTYHRWKRDFLVLNEHGYFQSSSYHYCRMCQALNFNEKTRKVYENITNWWSVSGDCRS